MFVITQQMHLQSESAKNCQKPNTVWTRIKSAGSLKTQHKSTKQDGDLYAATSAQSETDSYHHMLTLSNALNHIERLEDDGIFPANSCYIDHLGQKVTVIFYAKNDATNKYLYDVCLLLYIQ